MAGPVIKMRYRPHAGQQRMHDSPALIKCMECSRRWGKSRSCIHELVKAYLEAWEQERKSPDLIPSFHAWIIGPDMKQNRQPWRELVRMLPREIIQQTKKGKLNGIRFAEDMIYLKGSPNWDNYGVIEMKSAYKDDTLQTAGVDFLWVTEAQDISNAAAERFLPTTITPGRLGRIIYEGIPPTLSEHWFARAFDSAKQTMLTDGDDNPFEFAVKGTYQDNPLLSTFDRKRIENLRSTMGKLAWERMYLSKRTSFGVVFTKLDQCIAGDLLDEPIEGRKYVAGLDLGARIDATELCIMDAESRQVVGWHQWGSETTWPQRRQEIIALHEKWGFRRFPFDATSMGGDMAADELSQTNIPIEPIHFSNEKRKEYFELLIAATERGTVHFPAIPHLMRQLKLIEEKPIGVLGKTRYDHPIGEHDDAVVALMLCLNVCENAPPVVAYRSSGYNGRYLPTQSEAHSRRFRGRKRSNAVQVLRERKRERMEERAVTAGVDVA